MKVITEERLIEIFNKIPGNTSRMSWKVTKMVLANLLENELQEIDTLTVSKLRPMSEAKHFDKPEKE